MSEVFAQTVHVQSPHLSPIISESDKKQYRHLVLGNGLRVMLISDPKRSSSISTESTDDSSMHIADTDGSDDMDQGSEEEEEEEEKTDGKAKEQKCGAALCVNCGSFSDSFHIQGLAHFVEHMVFMGSEMFPEENGFDSYVTNNGGMSNAHTDLEFTTFYFSVPKVSMRDTLLRFAQFFISPLMRQDSMVREREAVDNEFSQSISSDANRREQLFCSLARDSHPLAKFMAGNNESLSVKGTGLPDENALHKELHDFWSKYYLAENMALAVQSEHDLDTLQEWVSEIFSSVPNHHSHVSNNFCQQKELLESCGLPWSNETFNRIYRIVSVKNKHILFVYWQLDPISRHYLTRPLDYISWLVGYEGKGSLFSYLKSQNLIMDLSAGSDSSYGFCDNTNFAIFEFRVLLTDDGLSRVEHIVQSLWAYLSLMCEAGVQQHLLDQLMCIDRNNFRFQDAFEVTDWVQLVAQGMLRFDIQNCVRSNFASFDTDVDLIETYFRCLVPEKCGIVISSKTFGTSNQCPLTEKWYSTKYSSECIPDSWKQYDFKAIQQHFHLPEDNIYIPKSFQLLKLESTQVPVRIVDEEFGEVFYKYDNKFCLPRAYVDISLSTSYLFHIHDCVYARLFSNIFQYVVSEDIYPAIISGMSFSMSSHSNVVSFIFSGYSDKLSLLIDLVISYLSDFESKHLTEEVFQLFKKQILMNMYNYIQNPESLCSSVGAELMGLTTSSYVKQHTAMLSANRTGLVTFLHNFCTNLYIQTLVQGNVSREWATDVYRSFVRSISSRAMFVTRDELTVSRYMRFENVQDGMCPCVQLHSFNTKDSTSCAIRYLQTDLLSLRFRCVIIVLCKLLQEPIFDQLRTKKQLAYYVTVHKHFYAGVACLAVLLIYQEDKYSIDHVDACIDQFFCDFSQILREMSDEHFTTIVQSCRKLRLIEDRSLAVEFNRNRLEIINREYLFDRRQRLADLFTTVTRQEVLSLFERVVVSRRSCVCVQVRGCRKEHHREVDEKACMRRQTLQYSTGINPCFTYVSSIDQFKRSLGVYPAYLVTE